LVLINRFCKIETKIAITFFVQLTNRFVFEQLIQLTCFSVFQFDFLILDFFAHLQWLSLSL